MSNSGSAPLEPLTLCSPNDDIRVLSSQGGARVLELDGDLVLKSGSRVRRSEEVAMRLVKQYTDVPVPEIIFSSFGSERGSIGMSLTPGSNLMLSWAGLDDHIKERVCHETWDLIAKLEQIPRPPDLSHLFQCSADGSPTRDPLIQALDNPPTPLLDDAALRARIVQRYAHFAGRRYTAELPSMLPRSDESVFTHSDIAPRNIMVDETHHITGLVDWEAAGWYPDYWEYANIMRPAYRCEEWQAWMDRTAPRKWDLSGIKAARRVLF